MTTEERDEVRNLADSILKSYFCENDIELLISSMADDIVWLGAGEHQKAEGKEAVSAAFLENIDNMMEFEMSGEEYIIAGQAPGVYLCEGVSRLRSTDPGSFMDMTQRITFIFRREKDGSLKASHIHNSVPLDTIKPGELFPIDEAKDNFKKLQSLLTARERQIELMLSQLPGGMQICYNDNDYSTKWISSGLYEMLGYKTYNEYFASTCGSSRSFVLPEDYGNMKSSVASSFAVGNSYSSEYRVRKASGEIIWVMDIGKLFVDDDGENVIACFITDITERVERDMKLREASKEVASQAKFLAFLYDTVPCGIIQFTVNEPYKMVSFNKRAAEIYGYGEDEYGVKMSDPFAAVLKKDIERIRAAVDGIAKNGGRASYERRSIRKDGSPCWISVTLERADNADGKRIMQAVFIDITEMKKLQEERERERNIENSSLKAAIFTAYQRITRVNLTKNSYVNLIDKGYINTDGSGCDYDALNARIVPLIHPSNRDDFKNTFSRSAIIRRFASGEKEIYREMRQLGDDGVYHWIAVHVIRVENPYNDDILEINLLKVMDDQRAEKMRQEQLLRDALSAAKDASRAKSDFLSRMSHDIRTPMNAIIGMSTLGQLKIGNETSVRDCFRKIDASSRYLLSLINDILDMSRIESGKMALSHTKFDLPELIEQVNSIIFPQAEALGINFDVYHVEPLERYYMGDPLRLNQIFMNLLSNSLKFTPDGGGAAIRIREKKRSNGFSFLEFTVSDTGVGMSREFLKHIYQPFEQESADTARNKAGSGLGLSIVYNLVQLMGGRIDVISEKGRGTTFTFTIPFELVYDNEAEETKRKTKELLAGLHVLVADDDEIVGEQTAAIMAGIGARSLWVDSGVKAVEAVRKSMERDDVFDVALIDWRMPNMDGVETTRNIRKLVGPETTIIIISAYDWSAIESEAREAGADYFLSKPLFQTSVCEALLRLDVDMHKKEKSVSGPGEVRYSGERVLLVEDNELNMEIAKSILEMHGLLIETAENGEAAVEMFSASETGYYDAILMDIRMPVMDGITAAEKIRKMPKKGALTVPIIAMSANAFEEDKAAAFKSGMSDYLVKPINMEDMFAVLNKWL